MGGRAAIDMTGVKSGNLKVICRDGSKGRSAMWRCICDCGNIFSARGGAIRSGATTSCGCIRDTQLVTHGMYKTNTYSSWTHMKGRCDNKKFHQFSDYGGRGITYDERWKIFENFYTDMGDCPNGYTLDRIDVNGDYNKENCKWSSRQEQSYRQRLSKRNKSGRSGVYQTKSNKWSAEIRYNRNKIHLGTFDTYELACNARSNAELKYFGFNKE